MVEVTSISVFDAVIAGVELAMVGAVNFGNFLGCALAFVAVVYLLNLVKVIFAK